MSNSWSYSKVKDHFSEEFEGIKTTGFLLKYYTDTNTANNMS